MESTKRIYDHLHVGPWRQYALISLVRDEGLRVRAYHLVK